MRMLQQRLRSDFHLAILSLMGAVMVTVVLPFATYRFVQGQWLTGMIDIGIVLGVAGAVGYAWRGGSVARAMLVGVLVYNFGCVAVAHLAGLAGPLWAYPVVLGNFLLVGRRTALATSSVSVLAIAVLASRNGTLAQPLDVVMFLCTTAVVATFAQVFAQRTEQQRRQLQQAAAHDPLTGASNRLTMDKELGIAIEQARRGGTPVGLAVLDLDHFKTVNDDYGHDCGDRVLTEFVRLVTARTRRGDRLFRYGGEEFVLLLPGADTGALQQRLEALRAAVARHLRIEDRRVTVSIGGAAWAPGENVEQWLARADAAMYEAKRNGRNCVVVDPP